MMFISRFLQIRKDARKARRRSKLRRARSFESLEDRCLLATFNISEPQDIVANDSLISLREAIEQVNNLPNGPHTVNIPDFPQDLELTEGVLAITTTEVVNIAGPGSTQLTVSSAASRVFDIGAGAHVTIDGLTLTGNSAGDGGAIRSLGADLHIEQVRFANNDAAGNGGAIYSSGGSLAINTSTFAHNKAFNGGAIYVDGGTLTADFPFISNNEAIANGGGIYLRGSIASIAGSGGGGGWINDNSAAIDGGGVFIAGGTVQISGLAIDHNTADRDGGGIAVIGGSLEITDVPLTNNSATELGGGLAVDFDSSFSLFPPQVALRGASQIAFNTADAGGGVSLNAADFTLEESAEVADNQSVRHGGGVFAQNATTDLRGTIRDNVAGDFGGGVYAVSGRTQFSGASVTDNQAVSGGGLFANTVTDGDSATLELSISGSSFAGNSAGSHTTQRIGGGGIHLVNTGDVLIDQTTITGSNGGPTTGGGLGGGLLVENSDGDVRIQRSTIFSTVANNGGGAALFGSGQATTTFLQSTISGNQVNARGGGVYVEGGTTEFLHSTITGNNAPQAGGGLFVSAGSSVVLDHAIVAANTNGTAPDIAGSVDARFSLIGSDTGTTIATGNDNIIGQAGTVIDPRLGPLADNGGPVRTHQPLLDSAAVNAGDPDFISSDPALNFDQRGAGYARLGYGRIDIGATELQATGLKLKVDNGLDEVDDDFSAGQLSLREAILLANFRAGTDTIDVAASLAGETVSLQGGELLITDEVTINGPSAGRLLINGNAASRILRIDDSDTGTALAVELNQLEFFAGHATGTVNDGGAILSREQLTLRDVVIRNSQANGFGGGVAVLDGALTIETSTITSNTATGDGGGIYSLVPTFVDRSTISHNDTQGAGGGISGINTLTITSSTVSGNHSINNGGGINVGARAAVVTHTTITNNASDASPGGGGIFADAPVTLDHSIVAVNSGRENNDLYQTQSGSFEATFSVIGSNSNADLQDDGGNIIGSSQTPLDPILQPLGDYGGPTRTHALDSRSLGLDAGDGSIVVPPAEDQRGFTRITGARIDVGAVEYQGNLLVVNTLLDIVDGDTVSIGALLQDSGADGQVSLREAILAANNTPGSDVIRFASTLDENVVTVTQTGSLDDSGLTGDLDITDDVTISGNGSQLTRVDATGLLDRVFEIHPDTVVTMSGLSISGGVLNEGDYGGGILVNSSTLSLNDVRVTDNEAQYGGGIAVVSAYGDATLNVLRSEIDHNRAGNSGGGVATLSGIKDQTAMSHIVESTVLGNEASRRGGGFYSLADTGGISLLRVDSSTVMQNQATNSDGRGGGIYNFATIGGGQASTAVLTISNSTLSANTAAFDGGGIYNRAADPLDSGVIEVRNVTITANDADNAGGGILNAANGVIGELHNTILADNSATFGADLQDNGILNHVTYNLIGLPDGHSIADQNAGNIVGTPAGIGPLADNGGLTLTHRLLPGSAAIDSGVNAEALNSTGEPLVKDQRAESFQRIIRGTVDIGATEFVFRDYGDAPDAAAGTATGNYQTRANDNGPSHVIFSGASSTVSLFLGATADGDDGTEQNAFANADDINGALPDDEDGVLRPLIDLALIEGTSPQVTISATNLTGSDAVLAGWIDYNGDGVFDVNTEQATVVVADGTASGLVTLSFPDVPVDSAARTYARFRLSTDAEFTVTPSPVGEVGDGEVEDYAVTITAPPELVAPAEGAPLHSMTHFTDTYNSSPIPPGGSIPDQNEPIVYDFPFQSVDYANRNYSEVHVQAGPGFVDVFDWAYNTGAYAPRRQEVLSTFKFDAFFASPNDTPINVALNLDITGVIDAENSTVQISVGTWSQQFGYGSYNENTGGEYFLTNFVADNTTQTITTQTKSGVAVNTPVSFFVNVRTINGYRPTSEVIDLSVALSRSGDVFRISGPDADSIVVTSTDVGIDNNRIQPRAVVPVPHKVSDTNGNFTGDLSDGDQFGSSITDLGDFDGDGVRDVAVGSPLDDDGAVDNGAVWILLMNSDGTVKSQTKLSALTEPSLNINFGEQFGSALASLGDLNGDGVTDLAVGSPRFQNGVGDRPGAVRILFMNADGSVASQRLLSSDIAALALDDLDSFGSSVTNLGDVNGDGISDLGVGAPGDDDRDVDAGALHYLLLDATGNVIGQKKTIGLEAGDLFGSSVSTLGDLDGDGRTEYVIGVPGNEGAGLNRGVAWIVFLNSDGRIRRRVTIGEGSGGFTAALDDDSQFGRAVAGVGDLNGDGVNDAIIGEQNRAWVLLLNSNGTVANAYRLENPDPADIGDFGAGINRLGDLTQDGFIDVAIGAKRDNDGGPERGAFYILEFGEVDTTPPVTIITAPSEVVADTDFTLDGSGSFDLPPGEIELYRWRRVGGLLDGRSIIDTRDPTLTVSSVGFEPGTETFELVTIDSSGNQSVPATVDILFVPPSADLHFSSPALMEVVSGGPVAVGEQLRLTLSPENLGPLTATNAQLTVVLPAGLEFDAVDVEGIANPSVTISGKFVTVDVSLDQVPTRDVELLVTVTEPTFLTVAATLAADEPDTQPANNQQSVLIVPEVLVVDTNVDIENGDFTAGDLSLREAVTLANADAAPNQINFTLPTGTVITLTGGDLPAVLGDVTITGPGAQDLAVGDNPEAIIFRIGSDVDVEISGLTIRGGNQGILNSGTLRVLQSVITNHDNRDPGDGLSLNSGGGIYNASNADLSIVESSVSGNRAYRGAGIYNVSLGTISIENSTISGNSASYDGGGIYNNPSGTVSLLNVTVASNRADANNLGTGDGGGLFNTGAGDSVVLHNTIVAENTRGTGTNDEIEGTVNSASSHNLIGGPSANGLSLSQNNLFVPISNNVHLGPLADNGGPTWTHALLGGSPAIDAGSNLKATEAELTLDQRGENRFRDGGNEAGRTDIGAYEAVATPTTFVVTTELDEDDGGLGIGAGDSLREVINAANDNVGVDTILFDGGLAAVITLTAGSLPRITDDVSVTGPGAQSLAVGDNPEAIIFRIGSDVDVEISGLTIRGGNQGILNSGTLRVLQSVITNHDNRDPGDGLSLNSGGGIYNASNADLSIVESSVSGNRAYRGAGIYNVSLGTISIENSTISGNSASYDGGGIYNNPSGTVSLLNVTVASNRADANNFGTGDGGGLFNTGAGDSVVLHNTIVAENIRGASMDSEIMGAVNSASSYNLIGASGGIGFSLSQNNLFVPIGNDVHLGPLADNGGPTWTHALLGGSPAIDAGSNLKATEAELTLDQRGENRFRDGGNEAGRTDIGAYEAVATPTTFVVTTELDEDDGGLGIGAGDSLREVINAANDNVGVDTILFDGGLAAVITLTAGSLPRITDDVSVTGPGAQSLAVGDNPEAIIFRIGSDVDVEISGLTIRGGNQGILNSGTLRVLQSVITNHDNRDPGDGLSLNSGGGIYNASNADLSIVESSVSGNRAYRGAGIYNVSLATISIENSTISGNSASYDGGGIYNNPSGTVSLLNVTVASNRADANNFGTGDGGGLFNTGAGDSVVLHNTIVAENIRGASMDSEIMGAVNSASSYNLIGASGGIGFSLSQNNLFVPIGNDVHLGPLADNGGPTWTHALLGGSPAIDAGSNLKAAEAGLTLDQRGENRFRDGGIEAGRTDIGAYEAVATPTTFVVTTELDEGDGGLGIGAGDSLREVINAANDNVGVDTILFDAGLAAVITLTAGSLPRITDDVSITGPGAQSLAVGDNPEATIFRVGSDVDVEISGLTIRGGNMGIWNSGTLRVLQSVITDHDNRDPGETLTLNSGGGIYNSASGSLNIVDSSISGNRAYRGAGIFGVVSSALSIENSTISGNTAEVYGGGIHNIGDVTIISSTISGNSAKYDGGGIYNDTNGTVSLLNATLADNRADVFNTGTAYGGGLFNADGAASLLLHNTIVADNIRGAVADSEIRGAVDSESSYNLIGASSAIGLSTSQHNLFVTSADGVRLGPLADNGGPTLTHALLGGSPAIDAGGNQKATEAGLTVDQRGVGRFRDGGIEAGRTDIGAYEAVATPTTFVVTTELDEDDGGLGVGAGDSLREVINAANGNVGVDAIIFAADLAPVITLTAGDLPTIVDDVSITGPGVKNLAVGDNPTATIFRIDNDAEVEISGLTLQGASRGITNYGQLTVRDSRIVDNTTTADVGIAGAGIQNFGTLTIDRSTLADNVAQVGGALYAHGGASTTIIDSTLSGNVGSENGGAIYTVGELTVVNSTLSGNSTNGDGGGIFDLTDTILLTNVTVTNNRADADGDGTGTGGGIRASGTGTLLHNTIVADNYAATDASDYAGGFDAGSSFNLFSSFSGFQGGVVPDPALGNLYAPDTAAVRLAPLADNGGATMTHALLGGSFAIDAGDNSRAVAAGGNPLATDQRGQSRIIAAAVDIGAYEAAAPVPSTFTVDTAVDVDNGDYSPGDLSLREAITLANDNVGADTIDFSLPNESVISLTSEPLPIIVDDLSVLGPGPDDLAVGDNPAVTILQVGVLGAGPTVEISGLTLQGASRGITNYGQLTVRDSRIVDNTTTADVGIAGAGIQNFGTLTIDRSTLADNVAQVGGALYAHGGASTTIIDSTLSGNVGTEDGGAIYTVGELTVVNSTLSGNLTNGDGGGIFDLTDTILLTNVTVTNNRADADGDGTGTGGGIRASGTGTLLHNTIVADNYAATDASDYAGGFDAGTSFNLFSSFSGFQGGVVPDPALGNLYAPDTAAVRLAPLADNGGATMTHALLGGSFAIDAGDNSRAVAAGGNPLATDQRGQSRIIAAAVDIGAYEAAAPVPSTFTVDTAVDVDNGDYSPGDLSLREAITLANDNVGADTIDFSLPNESVISLTSEPLPIIVDDLSVLGPGPDDLAVGDNPAVTILQVGVLGAGPTVEISGLTLRGAARGITNYGQLTVRDSRIVDNTTTAGVGIAGGGIQNFGTLTIDRSTLADNVAQVGGALYAHGGASTTIIDSTLSGNVGTEDGGAIYTVGELTVVNSTLSGNSTNGDGGGIFDFTETILLTNVTVAYNRADADGDGTGTGGGIRASGTGTLLHNTIVADNYAATDASDYAGGFDAGSSFNLFSSFSGFQGGVVPDPALGNLYAPDTAAVRLAPLADNGGPTLTHALLGGSPAIDAGGNQKATEAGLTFDQRGEDRFVDAGNGAAQVDIGAFEFRDVIAPTAVLNAPDEIPLGQDLILDGTASVDNHSAPLTYRWSRVGGLINGQSVVETTVPTLSVSTTGIPLGTETYQLIVIDSSSNTSSPATANVNIVEPEADLFFPLVTLEEIGPDYDGEVLVGDELFLNISTRNENAFTQSIFATNAQLEVVLPSGLELTDLEVEGIPNPDVSIDGQVLTIDLGPQFFAKGVGLFLVATQPGDVTVDLSLSADELDPVPGNNQESVSLSISEPEADLYFPSVTLEEIGPDDDGEVLVGDELFLDISTRNENAFTQSIFATNTQLQVVLPSGLELTDLEVEGIPNPDISIDGQILTIGLGPQFIAKGVGLLLIATQPGDVTVDLSLSADELDPVPGNNQESVSLSISEPEADLYFPSVTLEEIGPDDDGEVLVGDELFLDISTRNENAFTQSIFATNTQLQVILPSGLELTDLEVEGIPNPDVSIDGQVLTIGLGPQFIAKGVGLFLIATQPGDVAIDLSLSADELDPAPGNNQESVSLSISEPQADLYFPSVTLEEIGPDYDGEVLVGDELFLDISTRNENAFTQNILATNTQLQVVLPSGLELTDLEVEGIPNPDVSIDGQVLTIGLGPQFSAKGVGLYLIATQPADVSIDLSLSADELDPVPGNNQESVSLQIFPAIPEVITVTTTVDENDGMLGIGEDSLREAIEAANSNPDQNTIEFRSDLSGTIELLGSSLNILNNVVIQGPGSDVLSVMGRSGIRAFQVAAAAEATISDLTISGGRIVGGGSGINNYGTLTLDHVVITGNEATLFARGGGIYNRSSGDLTVLNSTISDNVAGADGGGIFNDGALFIANSTLNGNSARNGGAIANMGTAEIVNSTISGNTADEDGGGIYNGFFGDVDLTNVTVLLNDASEAAYLAGDGGGIFTANQNVTLHNSIVQQNSSRGGAQDIGGTVDPSSGHNLLGTQPGAPDSGGLTEANGNIFFAQNSMLSNRIGPLEDNGGPTRTHKLLGGHPGIDTGDSGKAIEAGLTADQRGSGRFVNGGSGVTRVDIGAYEAVSVDTTYFVTTELDENDDGLSTGAGDSLREVIRAANDNVGSDIIRFDLPPNSIIDLGTELPFIYDDTLLFGPGAGLLDIGYVLNKAAFQIGTTARVTLVGVTISNAAHGIRNTGSLTLREMVVTENTTQMNSPSVGRGGGIWDSGSSLIIVDSTISGNAAIDGGGIYVDGDGTLTLINSTVSNNSAANRGGGIYSAVFTELTHVTVVGNRSDSDGDGDGQGGGIFNNGAFYTRLHNSFIADNFAGIGSEGSEVAGVYWHASSHNLLGTSENAADAGNLSSGQNNLFVTDSVDLRIGSLADNGGPTKTHAILGGSPAIDAGDSALAVNEFGIPLAFDQRGTVRSGGASVDIGAFELFDSDEDGVDDSIEDLGPNGGDGDEDGIADSQQSHVASVRTPVDGSYVTILAPTGSSLQEVAALAAPPDGVTPSDAHLYPFGFLTFSVSGVAIGATIIVDVIPETTASLPGLINTFQKYGPSPDNATPHEYQFLYDGTTGAELLSDRIRLHFVDGQRGDGDVSANGTIVDPGAPAFNPAPNIDSISGLDVAVTGQPVDVTSLFTDLGTETHTATIHWGDGTTGLGDVSEVSGGGTVTASHTYGQPGSYTIHIDLRDQFGNVASVEKSILIETLLLMDDPENPGKSILTVGGTPGRDRIDFKPKRGGRLIEVRRNGRRQGRYPVKQLSLLVAYGGAGADKIKVHGRINLPSEFHGGTGDDTIRGSRGLNVIFGGDGDDFIATRHAADIIFSGPGNDVIWSGGGNDVIHAGDGNNVVWTGRGDDRITTGDGNDWIFCGVGQDTVQSGGGRDLVFCDGINGRARNKHRAGSSASRLRDRRILDELFDDWDSHQFFFDRVRKDQQEAFDKIFADQVDDLLTRISL